MDDRLIRDLELLVRLVKDGGWNEVSVRSGSLSLKLAQHGQVLPARRDIFSRTLDRTPRRSESVDLDVDPANLAETAIDPTWLMISAPNLGTFYRSPKPGSPPFVKVGQSVSEGVELCLIEVMKLFTSVRAPISGTVRHIAPNDGALVEGNQPLIYLQPD